MKKYSKIGLVTVVFVILLIGSITLIKAQNTAQNGPVVPTGIQIPSLEQILAWLKSSITFDSVKTFLSNSLREVLYFNIPIIDTNISSMLRDVMEWVQNEFRYLEQTFQKLI